jgi:hypothetical protein
MYKYILKNKLIFLSIAAVLVIYTMLKCKQHEEKNIMIEQLPTPESKVLPSNKILDTEVITEQLRQNLEQDNANFLIDNDLLDGKIELPEVSYTDPAIADLLVHVINEKNEDTLKAYTRGSAVFNQTMLKHPSNTECYKYTCMPGAYTQCTNNVYCNSNKNCECRVIDVCR